jgi:hypothetical protein
MKSFVVIAALFACASAGNLGQQQVVAEPAYAQQGYAQQGYAQQGYIQQQAYVAQPALVSGAPQKYSQAIPAAAIRNVETVGVTKTITPVVTKTTTTQTHLEPAVSVGHVQGYSQSAVGAPRVAPVQYNTQYTSYVNPTVGVNGPVTYAGPAHSAGIAVAAQPVYAQAAPAYAAAPVYAQAAPAYAAAPVYAQAAPAYAAAPAYGGVYAVQPAISYAQPQFAYAAAPAYAQVQQQAYVAAPSQSYGAAPSQSYGAH